MKSYRDRAKETVFEVNATMFLDKYQLQQISHYSLAIRATLQCKCLGTTFWHDLFIIHPGAYGHPLLQTLLDRMSVNAGYGEDVTEITS